MALRLSDLQSVRPAFNLFTMLAETVGVGDLKTPGGAAAYRGYSAVRFGSPEKAQRAASGKTPVRQNRCQPITVSTPACDL